MGRAQDEINRLKAIQAQQVQAQRAGREASRTTPGAPTVATPTPQTNLKAATTPTTATTTGTTTAPIVTTTPGWEPAPGQGATPSIIEDAAAANAAKLPPGPEATRIPGFEATRIPTGPVMPKVQAAEPNALLRPEGVFDRKVQESAQNYRDLAARNASPAEQSVAKQDYANALSAKAAAQPFRSASQAFGTPERNQAYLRERAALPKTAYERAAGQENQRVLAERWQREFPDIKPPEDLASEKGKAAYYNLTLQRNLGENPYTIGSGGATLTHPGEFGGGMRVTPIKEQIKAQGEVNEQIKEAKMLQKAERGYKTKGEFDKAADARKQLQKLEFESGLKDPANPKAGWDPQNAIKNNLLAKQLEREPSSIAGLAQKDLGKQAMDKAAAKEEPRVAERGQQDLVDAIERNRIAHQAWLDELKRRQNMTLAAY